MPIGTQYRRVFCALTFSLGACRQESARGIADEPPAPWLTKVIDQRIIEPSVIATGNLVLGVRAASGATYLSDNAGARILVLDGDGALRQLFGGRGRGPGEFVLPGSLALLAGDSILAAVDDGTRRITLFDLAGDSVLRIVPSPSFAVGTNWNVRGDSASFSLPAADSALARWNWRSGIPEPLGAASARVRSDQLTVLQHGRPEVVRHGEGWLAVFPAEPGIHVLDAAGRRVRQVTLPSRTRRGVPSRIFELAAERQKDPLAERAMEPIGSMVFGMARLASGAVAVAHLDVEQVAPAERGASPDLILGNFVLRLSLLSADLQRVCVDGRVPIESDLFPFPFFRADTMFVLTKRLETGIVDSRLHGFVVQADKCVWEPAPAGGVRVRQ